MCIIMIFKKSLILFLDFYFLSFQKVLYDDDVYEVRKLKKICCCFFFEKRTSKKRPKRQNKHTKTNEMSEFIVLYCIVGAMKNKEIYNKTLLILHNSNSQILEYHSETVYWRLLLNLASCCYPMSVFDFDSSKFWTFLMFQFRSWNYSSSSPLRLQIIESLRIDLKVSDWFESKLQFL